MELALQEVADIGARRQPLALENIPAWDPAWAQEEIERFRTLWDWGRFTQLLAKKLRTSPRRALSAHTTTACQPKKADGPGGSLYYAGMGKILPAVGGQFFVRVNLPHAFSYGDGLAVTYVSTAEKRRQGGSEPGLLGVVVLLGSVSSRPGQVAPWLLRAGRGRHRRFSRQGHRVQPTGGFHRAESGMANP